MNKTTIVVVIIILVIIFGAWWMLSNQEEMDEPTRDEGGPEEMEEEQPMEGEDEAPQGNTPELPEGDTGQEDEGDQEDPYASAETVEAIEDKNVAMDEVFSEVLAVVFEEEPKLVETGEINRVSYVVDRVITTDDVKEIRDLLAERGYETVNSSSEGDKYELDLSISDDVLEEKYDGDPGGNMYINIWTAEEGENAQRIQVETL